ncbi:3-deoxy-7-phosphoheptulonate synthase [Kushneria aurantia]|uniref:Phospho-2-dehydro-3-deoxyheptonate aldolase n=1 Tax=Kushneria aurantia TaxID=504092 RepID=A0ABV6G526_9GAMM|nr:3-deoxy-7-phosphoheptulonate synthase [Kushneria aurantia]
MNAQLDTALAETDASLDVDAEIAGSRLLPTADELRRAVPLDPALEARIHRQRDAIRDVLAGRDERLLVVIGPCSIHDRDSALDYAGRLAELNAQLGDVLLPVMRVYVEKPRTTVGWKGLAYDPHLDGSDDMAEGLYQTRRLMRDITALGLPIACELLQPMLVDYIEDLLGWAAVGARTTESQVHREMVSALGLPVGFKNATSGDIGVAVDAMGASRHGHRYPGLDAHGRPALLTSKGNPDTQLVLRGGQRGPNFDAASVERARGALLEGGLDGSIMVDCSHANSGKDPARQPAVLDDVLRQRLAGQRALTGVMLESHILSGKQKLGGELRYGVSVTDGCLGWEESAALLTRAAQQLRQGVSAGERLSACATN